MMPYTRINIGDVFASPSRHAGSSLEYTVTDKADGMIQIESSYQHPALPARLWKKPTDRIFITRLLDASKRGVSL